MLIRNSLIVAAITVMLGLNLSVGYLAFTEPPNYSVATAPDIVSVYQGESGSFGVDLSSLRGFDSQVRLRVVDPPEGIAVDFDSNVTQLGGDENVSLTVDFTVASDSHAGLYDLVVEANSGGLIHTAVEKLNIIGTGRVIIEIRDFWYYPNNLTIRKGADVTWVNEDLTGHTATADDGAFDSELLQQNQEYTLRFDTVGVNPYYCVPHPQMVGEIRVVD
jgi:plastocyanin